jgi:hypothetical protein
MKIRPSGNATIPLQNMSHPTGCVTIVPACGSHTAARKFVTFESFPDPATTSTRPVYVSAMWIGLIGIVYDNVRHRPLTFACANSTGFATPIRPAAIRTAPPTNEGWIRWDRAERISPLPANNPSRVAEPARLSAWRPSSVSLGVDGRHVSHCATAEPKARCSFLPGVTGAFYDMSARSGPLLNPSYVRLSRR